MVRRAADCEQRSQKFKKSRKKKRIPKSILTSSSLSVTCGDKVGILHKDKLHGGSTTCILSNEIWMTPNEFQKYGGCQSYKNWKISIKCEGICLKELMRRNYLTFSDLPQTSKAIRNRKAPELPQTSKARNYLKLSDLPQTSKAIKNLEAHELPLTSKAIKNRKAPELPQTSKARNYLKFSDLPQTSKARKNLEAHELPQTSKAIKNRKAPELPQTSKAVSNEDSNADANKTVKLSTSDVPVQCTLPVSCGDFEGTLHINRFGQGNCGKCIRTSKRWCTPLQFLALSGVPDSNTWDAQIYVRGESLYTLLQKNLLRLHDAGCCCDVCTDCDSQQNDDDCSVCGDGGDLLCCEECPRAFHSNCHEPSITEMESSSERWICTFCKMKQMRKQSEPQELLSCQYFLLHVLCDPNNELSIIQSKPKELELLKKRLHRMEGGEEECPWNFISDVTLAVLGAHPPQKKERLQGLLKKEYNQLMLS